MLSQANYQVSVQIAENGPLRDVAVDYNLEVETNGDGDDSFLYNAHPKPLLNPPVSHGL